MTLYGQWTQNKPGTDTGGKVIPPAGDSMVATSYLLTLIVGAGTATLALKRRKEECA
jgi:hypothetical protein